MAKLNRYAELNGQHLMIAIYWANLCQWTINRAEDITAPNGGINVQFIDALQKNRGAEFGDRTVMAIPPILCRFWMDPEKPRRIRDDDLADSTIGNATFHTRDAEITDPFEKELALYFIFHSSWVDRECVAHMKDGALDYIEFESAPDEDRLSPDQPMQSLGTLAGMISNYYNWLTVAEDKKIVRLTPDAQPGTLASGLDDSFRGKVLKLWVFEIQPDTHGTLRAT